MIRTSPTLPSNSPTIRFLIVASIAPSSSSVSVDGSERTRSIVRDGPEVNTLTESIDWMGRRASTSAGAGFSGVCRSASTCAGRGGREGSRRERRTAWIRGGSDGSAVWSVVPVSEGAQEYEVRTNQLLKRAYSDLHPTVQDHRRNQESTDGVEHWIPEVCTRLRLVSMCAGTARQAYNSSQRDQAPSRV